MSDDPRSPAPLIKLAPRIKVSDIAKAASSPYSAYFVAEGGLGNLIADYFIAVGKSDADETALILPRLAAGVASGECRRAAVVYKCYTDAARELLGALPLDLHIISDSDGLEGDWYDVRQRPPAGFQDLPVSGPMALPARRPKLWLPDQYILLMDNASALDRCLTNHLIYHLVANVTRLPVVKVGNSPGWHSEVPADIDLYMNTTIQETVWLAQHARAIVSAASFMRVFAGLFSVPVIEILQEDRVCQATRDRTEREYRCGNTGMTPLNSYFYFPSQTVALETALEVYRY